MGNHFVTTDEQAWAAIRAVVDSDGVVAFDTETSGLNVRGPGQDFERTLQVAVRPWEDSYVFETTDRWRLLIQHLFEKATGLIAHNLRFDTHVMDTYGIDFSHIPHEARHDTAWVARLHDERDGARLKPLAAQYLRADAAAEQGKLKRLMTKHGWTWGTVPIEHLIEYGGNDATITGQLFDLLKPRIGHSEDAYRREQLLSPILYRMERTGLLVDTQALYTIIEGLEAVVAQAKTDIEAEAPGINPGSVPQLKGEFRKRGHEMKSTDAPTLKALVSKTGDGLAVAILAFRKASKALNTYARPWLTFIADDGRIHPSLNQMGTITGRFSSDLPNFQNIPKKGGLRNAVIASPGHQLVVADWNQMELRLYAHFAQDENMRAAFLSGDDIYEQAADLLGVPRAVGKMVMLASIYGAGAKTLKTQCIAMSYTYDLDHLIPELLTYDWPAMHARFHAAYAIKDLARFTELAARRRGQFGEGYVRTLGGRRQRPKRIKLPAVNGYRQTIYVYKDLGNSLVQGSSADLMKMALLDADAAGLGPYMRLTVHDEMVLEVPDEKVSEVKTTLERVMTRSEFVPPLTVEASAALRYGEAK